MKAKQNFNLLAAIVVLGIIALGCSITLPAIGVEKPENTPLAPAPSPTEIAKPTTASSEPIPSLMGKWQYHDENGNLLYDFDIVWNGQAYTVENCVGYGDVICEIKSQSWDGTTLKWTNYYPHTDYTTEHTVISVSGDELLASRSGTGGTGTVIYRRAP